ncbi:GIY-YIG nuclease family protein [Rhizobium leguminosarum]|uniref:GIY-YIG nuclease family protein n=1 Tax=Rhizobium leguminosarum TaxID=384 RepID=UPI003F995F5E
MMNERFAEIVGRLPERFEELMRMTPVRNGIARPDMKGSGVYLFSEQTVDKEAPLYVGRTDRLDKRYREHTGQSSDHNKAPFAFKLARIETGRLRASYRRGGETRAALMTDPDFVAVFRRCLQRVSTMNFRYVLEADPTTQCLLEVYCSVALQSQHNTWKNH